MADMPIIISHKNAKAQGLPFYYTGEPCKHGHIEKRYTCNGTCVACNESQSLKWQGANPEKVAAMRRAKGAVYSANYYWRDPERQKNNTARYLAKHPDRRRQLEQRRRNAEGRFTAEDLSSIRTTQGDRCAYCKKRLKGGGHLDHIIPIKLGGSNWPKNLQWLCQPCNNRKSATDPVVYARKLGLLI